MGVFTGFICAACSCLQGEMDLEQPKRRCVITEHCGMQDLRMSLAGPRGSILPPSWTRRAASFFPTGCPTSPQQHPLHPVGLAGGGRATSEPGAVRGERQRSPHSLRGSWEHVVWGRTRRCSEMQHSFAAGTGSAEALGMPMCTCIWEEGKKERAGIFFGRSEGTRTCFGGSNNWERGSCGPQISDCFRQQGYKLVPHVNQSHSVPHVLLLSRHEGLCVLKTSHPIIPLISLSWRLWLLQRLFKMSLIQSSFVLQRSWLYRAALPKDVRIGDIVQHEAVRAAEEGVEVFGPRRGGGVRWF